MTRHPAVRRTHHQAESHPYVDHARLWHRYVRRLQDRPFDASRKKEAALACSLRWRSRTLILPTRLVPAEQGLRRLTRAADEHEARFVELAARTVEVDADDPAADEVHLFVEEPDRTSSRNRRYLVGLLPREDACWVVPLLRLETDAYGTGPVLGFFVERSSLRSQARGGIRQDDVRVVIAHAHEAARHWLDWQEVRAARYDASYRLQYYDEQAYHYH